MSDLSRQPTRPALVLTWLLLAGLTVGSMVTAFTDGNAASTAALTALQVTVILVLTAVKARQILSVFLNLRRSTAGWRALFAAFVIAILAVILGGHMVIGVV